MAEDRHGTLYGAIALQCQDCNETLAWDIETVRNISTAIGWAKSLGWGKSKGFWYCKQHNPIKGLADLTVVCDHCSTQTIVPGNKRLTLANYLYSKGWRAERDELLLQTGDEIRHTNKGVGEWHIYCPAHTKQIRERTYVIEMREAPPGLSWEDILANRMGDDNTRE